MAAGVRFLFPDAERFFLSGMAQRLFAEAELPGAERFLLVVVQRLAPVAWPALVDVFWTPRSVFPGRRPAEVRCFLAVPACRLFLEDEGLFFIKN